MDLLLGDLVRVQARYHSALMENSPVVLSRLFGHWFRSEPAGIPALYPDLDPLQLGERIEERNNRRPNFRLRDRSILQLMVELIAFGQQAQARAVRALIDAG
jgi:hypothetical protein